MSSTFMRFRTSERSNIMGNECTGRVFVRIDGEYTDLRCSYSADDDSFRIYGAWAGYDLNTGMFNRNVRSLAQLAGRELTLVFPISEPGKFEPDHYYNSETMKLYRAMEMSNKALPEGDYYIEYEIYDLFMRPMPMEKIRVHWDGANITLADGYTWEGEELLTVPDEFWY